MCERGTLLAGRLLNPTLKPKILCRAVGKGSHNYYVHHNKDVNKVY